ncbi:MAG: bifunctional oligoribonuclease/PAP phosphatase NrnA [Firmicutes bacterium]|nr:bifunctional oligoribonuclease/PAP phosphatase NrnA [Candidatus Fermentithermobacillaceae bacterium]
MTHNWASEGLARARELVLSHRRFVILEHEKPDGDCVGSSLALALALENWGKQALIVSDDPHPVIYDFLPGQEHFTRTGYLDLADFYAEVAIFLDCGEPERCGHALPFAKKAKYWINIDHHVSNTKFGDAVLVDPSAAATGEILWHFFRELGVNIDARIAACLYVAVLTDTGSFRYENTTPRALRMAADLIERGARPQEISELVYEAKPLSSVMLLGEALQTLEIHAGGKIACVSVTREMMKKVAATSEDTEGIITYPRSIQGVMVAVQFREADEGVHVSFRTRRTVDAARIAETFGGGGHPRAAGALIKGKTLPEVKTLVLEEVRRVLEQDPDLVVKA